MSKLLKRELTKAERDVAESLQRVLAQRGKAGGIKPQTRRIAAEAPEEFAAAALWLVDSEADPGASRWLYLQPVECPEFLIHLIVPDRYSREESLESSAAA